MQAARLKSRLVSEENRWSRSISNSTTFSVTARNSMAASSQVPSFFLRGVTDQILLGEYGQELTHKEGITAGFSLQEPLPAGLPPQDGSGRYGRAVCEM